MNERVLILVIVAVAASVGAVFAILQGSILAKISYTIVPSPSYSVQQVSINLGAIQAGSSGSASGSGSISVYSGTICFTPILNPNICSNFTSFTAYIYINGNLTWVLSCSNTQAQPTCLGPGTYTVNVNVNYQAENCFVMMSSGSGQQACYEASNEPLIYITPTS